MQSGCKSLFQSVFVCLTIVIVPFIANAQTQTTGAVQGSVYESDRKTPIAEAIVKITNEETGLVRTTISNAEGFYYIGMLPPGLYSLNAARDGYEPEDLSATNNFPIRLSKSNLVQLPWMILRKVGTTATAPATQTVTPAAGTTGDSEVEQLVNTVNATRGGNFDKRQLTSLPLADVRSFESLAFLLPGVALPPQPVGNSVGPGIGAGVGTSGQFSVNGSRSRSNNFTVDGSDNNDEDVGVRRQGFVALVPQSIESVQEFQMFTHLWDAGNGRNTGSQANAISQSGTNLVHGSAYGFFNHDALNARNFFDYRSDKAASYALTARSLARFTGTPDAIVPARIVNPDGTLRDVVQPNPSQDENPFQRYQAGFTLGGPVSKKFFGPLAPADAPRTFYFTSYERQQIRARQETHFSVPTIAQRGFLGSGASGFSIPGLTLGTTANPQNAIFRPTFTAGDAVFSLFPFPNNPVGPYGENTLTQVLPANGEGNVFSMKLDHNFTLFGPEVRHTFTARYNHTQDERQLPTTGGALFSGVDSGIGTRNLSLFLNSQLSARISNQIRGSFGRTKLRFTAIRDPYLSPTSLVLNDPLNNQFLLNTNTRLLNISCTDIPSLPVQGRAGCFGFSVRNRFATFFPENPTGTIAGFQPQVLGVENNLRTVGQLLVHPFSPLGADSYLFPQGRVNNTYQIADTLTYFAGSHALTFGADVRHTQLNSFLNRNFRPQLVFGGSADQTFNAPAAGLAASVQGLSRLGTTPGFFSGADLAALGFPTGIFQAVSIGQPDSTIGLRFWQQNYFFGDNWRVRPGLTLGYGVRYEYNSVPREANDRIEKTFDLSGVPASDAAFNLGTANNPLFQSAFDATQNALRDFLGGRKTIYDPDRNNVGGYASFAWDPFAGRASQTGRTVIRGGAGVYYDVTLGSVVSQSRNVFPTFIPFNLDAGFFPASTLFALYTQFPQGFTRTYTPLEFGLNIGGTANLFQGSGCTAANQAQTVFGCSLIQPGTLNQLSLPGGVLQRYLGRVLNTFAATGRASGSGLSFTLPDRNLQAPQFYQYNLQFERELFGDYLFNAAYVGARGTQLTRFRTPNGGLNSPTSPLNILGFNTTPLLPPAQIRAPLRTATANARPISALGAYQIFDSSAASTYHALQTSMTKRFSNGWQMTAAYTWSHALDDVSDVFDLAGAFNLPQDDRNLRLERGDANFDLRHRFVYSVVSEVPFLNRFNNAQGATGVLFGNWQFASISTWQTGQPFTVNTSFDVNQDGNLTDRLNTTSGLNILDDRQQKLSFTGNPTTLFAAVGQNGAVGRNTFRASGIAKTDFSVFKNFKLREGQSLVLRAEAFNLWNRTHFATPVRILEAPSFGQSVSTSLPARQIQFALKYLF